MHGVAAGTKDFVLLSSYTWEKENDTKPQNQTLTALRPLGKLGFNQVGRDCFCFVHSQRSLISLHLSFAGYLFPNDHTLNHNTGILSGLHSAYNRPFMVRHGFRAHVLRISFKQLVRALPHVLEPGDQLKCDVFGHFDQDRRLRGWSFWVGL